MDYEYNRQSSGSRAPPPPPFKPKSSVDNRNNQYANQTGETGSPQGYGQTNDYQTSSYNTSGPSDQQTENYQSWQTNQTASNDQQNYSNYDNNQYDLNQTPQGPGNTEMANFNNNYNKPGVNPNIYALSPSEDMLKTRNGIGRPTNGVGIIENPDIRYLEDGTVEVDCSPYVWKAPSDASLHPYKDHQGEGAQYLRDFILGVNDGLISTLLLVLTLFAGGAQSKVILLSALAGAVAGAVAMGLGEYIATKSQNEVTSGEIKLEKEHFKYHRDLEVAQLRWFLKEIGLTGPLLEASVKVIASDDKRLMKVMEKFEFGSEEDDAEFSRNPFTAMFMSGRLFFMGAMPATLPFISNDRNIGLAIAIPLALLVLFAVGVYKTKTTGGSPLRGGLENFAAGVVGGSLSFVVGLIFGQIQAKAA